VESMPHRREFSHPAQLQLVDRIRRCVSWEDRIVEGVLQSLSAGCELIAAWREDC